MWRNRKIYLSIYLSICYTNVYAQTLKTDSITELKTLSKNQNWNDFHKLRWQLQHSNHLRKRATTFEYAGYYFKKTNQLDSAYYYYNKSYNIYKHLQDSVRVGMCLLNIAVLEKNTNNLIASEISSFEILKYSKNKQRLRASAYNNLGIIFSQKKNYNEALNYHQKAYTLRQQLPEKIYILHSLNNIGNIYKKQHQHKKAITYYKKALQSSISVAKYPNVKATLLNNYAHSLLLQKQFNKLPKLFFDALHIRNTIQDTLGIIDSHIDIGTYYTKINKPKKAIQYLEKAYTQAKKNRHYIDVLKSLQLLMEVYPKEQAVKSAKEYIFLNDSLQQAERLVKDQFAKVRFETAEKEQALAENKILLQEENKQKWLYGIGLLLSILILTIFGYYYRKNQQQKRLIEGLQKELHHRVKNNLSIIDRFVEILKEEFKEQKITSKLNELQNRIGSINEVHQQLYSSKNVTKLNIKTYVNQLVNNVKNSFPNTKIHITQNIKDDIVLTSTKSFPLGIIINEFLTNSYKYAFEKNKGTITIQIQENKQNYILSLSDNGKGLPSNFNIKSDANFGLRIIRLLCNQLNATFNLENNNGVQLTINLPK